MNAYPSHMTIADIRYSITQVLRGVLGIDTAYPHAAGGNAYFDTSNATSYDHIGERILENTRVRLTSGKINVIETMSGVAIYPLRMLHDVINMLWIGRQPSVDEL